ncbi:hypothetical protein FRC09_019667 [Ceratobasidium sp. 395]|nr:hypothetical protein FRC09_019667 [Ceratobasidium sp. 395]
MAVPAIPRVQLDALVATESPRCPIVRLSRSFAVSAAHRLHSVHLTDEENAKVYGPCNRLHGHGHNYKITVSLAGQVDPRTGMVINLRVLKSIAQQYVAELIDHRNLDIEVEFFSTRPSTTENLAIFVWQQISVGLKENGFLESLLDDVTIEETDANAVSYSGKCG